MTMGEKILNMRKARGWSQEELADRVGVTRQAVSRWESGSAKPDADKIIAISDLFGVSADYLLRDQYAGEGDTAQPQERGTTALGQAVRGMSLKQWAAFGAMLLGGLVMFVLKIIYVMKNTNYYYCSGNGAEYSGFTAFLMYEELALVWYLALAAALTGALYLFLLPLLRKDKENVGWLFHSD